MDPVENAPHEIKETEEAIKKRPNMYDIMRWTPRQQMLLQWLRERSETKTEPRVSIILDRKYKQKTQLGFTGVSTLLAAYVINELSDCSGLIYGLGRDNKKFLDKIVEFYPSDRMCLLVKNDEMSRFQETDGQGKIHVWTSLGLYTNTTDDSIRGIGPFNMMVSDSLTWETFQYALQQAMVHHCFQPEFNRHIIWVVKTWREEEDNQVIAYCQEKLGNFVDYQIHVVEK